MEPNNIDLNHSFNVNVASVTGIEKAIILKELYRWCSHNLHKAHNSFGGLTWVFYSASAIEKSHPYLKRRSICRWMNEMEDDCLLVSTQTLNKMGNDDTKWYSVNYKAYEHMVMTATPVGKEIKEEWVGIKKKALDWISNRAGQNNQPPGHFGQPPGQNGQPLPPLTTPHVLFKKKNQKGIGDCEDKKQEKASIEERQHTDAVLPDSWKCRPWDETVALVEKNIGPALGSGRVTQERLNQLWGLWVEFIKNEINPIVGPKHFKLLQSMEKHFFDSRFILLVEFLGYKKDMKQTYKSEKTIPLQIKKTWSKFTFQELREALDETISKEWKGLFPKKVKPAFTNVARPAYTDKNPGAIKLKLPEGVAGSIAHSLR